MPAVQAAERSAGERFRAEADPRVAACADHDPMSADELHELIDHGRAWVAEEDGAVVGFLAARPFDGCGHVEEVAVTSSAGRRGHATALLEQAAGWALEQGLPALTLTTFRDVGWNRPLYEKRGFRVLADDDLTPALRALVAEEEEQHGLPAELRVVMRRDLP